MYVHVQILVHVHVVIRFILKHMIDNLFIHPFEVKPQEFIPLNIKEGHLFSKLKNKAKTKRKYIQFTFPHF